MQAKIGRPLRKATGVAAVAILWQYPEAAAGLFLLWLFWDSLDRMARRTYADYHVRKARKALREDLHTRVEPCIIPIMNERIRAEREKKERSRQRRERLRCFAKALADNVLAPFRANVGTWRKTDEEGG
jgi:hypothetical protein